MSSVAVQRYAESFAAGLRPDPNLLVSEWADANRMLSSIESPEPGPWRTDRTPYLREIMDCLSPSSPVQEVIVEKGKQVGFTVGVAGNFVGYAIAHCPAVMLIVMPTVETAKRWSRQKLTPLIEGTPCLRGKVADARERDSHNTILSKEFEGGLMILTGANSAVGLRSTSARYMIFDEVDGYPKDVDGEGDPMELAKGRSVNYSQRKILEGSTPDIEALSRIDPEFRKGDMRYYFVPCPFCRHFQVFKFEQLEYWPKDRPEHVAYRCESCSEKIDERWKTQMLEQGRWAPTADLPVDLVKVGFPETELAARAMEPNGRRVSYHLSGLYSPIGWFSWLAAAQQFVEAQGNPALLKVFVNTVLGETWKDRGEAPDHEKVWLRREHYQAFSAGGLGSRDAILWNEEARVPARALFLTAGVDVQGSPARLEVGVKAWGRGKESWHLGYWVLDGEITSVRGEAWRLLNQLLAKDFPHELGGSLPIMAMAIDTGYQANVVYDFAQRHAQPAHSDGSGSRVHSMRTVVPTAGDDDWQKVIASVSKTDAAHKRQDVRIWKVGGGFVKPELYAWLRLAVPDDAALPYPGYAHYPEYQRDFFRGLCSEDRKVTASGKVEWVKNYNRNEPLDVEQYARLAAAVCGMDAWRERHWQELERRVGITAAPLPPITVAQPVKPTQDLQTQQFVKPVPPSQPMRRAVRGRLSSL